MDRHEFFDLWIHDDAELAAVLNEPIVARREIHAWPLSSVQLVMLQSGRRVIYKAQREPTVEPEFLERAASPALPPFELVSRDEQQAAIVLPYFEQPTLQRAGYDAAGLAAYGRRLVAQFGAIDGDVPVYVDIGTPERWRAFAAHVAELLLALVGSGQFSLVAADDVAALMRWAERCEVLQAVDRTSQLINGDFKAEHVFCGAGAGGADVVVDWQRPYRAPAEIDIVSLLESAQIDPAPHVAPVAIGLRAFLFVHWAAEAKTHLLPQLGLFDQWARMGIDTILASQH